MSILDDSDFSDLGDNPKEARRRRNLNTLHLIVEDAVNKGMQHAIENSVKVAVAEGVKTAIIELSKDDQFGEMFWKKGYLSLAKHVSESSSQWIGGRILTALVMTAVGFGITYLISKGKWPA